MCSGNTRGHDFDTTPRDDDDFDERASRVLPKKQSLSLSLSSVLLGGALCTFFFCVCVRRKEEFKKSSFFSSSLLHVETEKVKKVKNHVFNTLNTKKWNKKTLSKKGGGGGKKSRHLIIIKIIIINRDKDDARKVLTF